MSSFKEGDRNPRAGGAATLAEALLEAERAGWDLRHAEVLMDYDRRRRVDAGVTAAMTDGLNLCSATSSVRPSWCAGSGMDALDRLPRSSIWRCGRQWG
jgi:2-polyprenyl-6-methoxyphenol hydroxylase-like FAD-dependent oxidoreductase